MATKSSNRVSVDMLRRLIEYDAITGMLIWKPRTPDLFNARQLSAEHCCKVWNTSNAGTPALQCKNGNGYHHGAIFGVTYTAHSVAWALYHGSWPLHGIDHIDGNRSNNSIVNLRDVPDKINAKNQKRNRRNTSGVTGVSYFARTRKWVAMIKGGGKVRNLGYYATLEEAAAARKRAEQQFGFHPNHGRAA